MGCPNKNLPEYQDLEKELGEIKALAVFDLNNEVIPTLDQAKKLLDSKSLNILHHAETPLDLQDKTSGPIGEGLSKEGIAEAEKNAQTPEIQALRKIYCSDAPRAIQTCEIYKQFNPSLEVQINPGLRTWDRGKFIGKKEDTFPTEYYLNRPEEVVPGGESFKSFFDTFAATINSLRNESETTGILVHGDGVKTLTSLSKNYGEFSVKDYLHQVTQDAAQKPFQSIRQFNQEQNIETKGFGVGILNPKYNQLSFAAQKHLGAYLEKSRGLLPPQFFDEGTRKLWVKSSTKKSSKQYNIIDPESGEIIAEKQRLDINQKQSWQDKQTKVANEINNLKTKSEEQKKYGIGEIVPGKRSGVEKDVSVARKVAFLAYLNKPSKERYVRTAANYLYEGAKFSGVNIPVTIIEKMLERFPKEIWDYIIAKKTVEEPTLGALTRGHIPEITSISKISKIKAIEKALGVELLGKEFKTRRSYNSFDDRQWGENIKIDPKNRGKYLSADIREYLEQKGLAKPPISDDEGMRNYAEIHNMTLEQVKELVTPKEQANEDGLYIGTENYDMEMSKFRQNVFNTSKTDVAMHNATTQLRKDISTKLQEKIKSGTIKPEWLETGFHLFDILFNKVGWQELDQAGDPSFHTAFNRLAAIVHEPFHVMHALTYGTQEEREMKSAWDQLYSTKIGREIVDSMELQDSSEHVKYAETVAHLFQAIILPPEYLKNLSPKYKILSDAYAYIQFKLNNPESKEESLGEETNNSSYTEIEKKETLSFLQKFLNWLIKAFNKVAEFFGKELPYLERNVDIEKEHVGEDETPSKLTPSRDLQIHEKDFVTAMDNLSASIEQLLDIDKNKITTNKSGEFFAGAADFNMGESNIESTSQQPTLFDNSLPFNEVQQRILTGFTKEKGIVLYPKRVGDVKLKDTWTTKTGTLNKNVALSMQKWIDGIPDFKSAQIDYSEVENGIRIVPNPKLFSQGGTISGGQYINTSSEPTLGLTPISSFVTPTSEEPQYKNTNNLTPDSFEDSINKMKSAQDKIQLHDLITDPVTGQVREHKYTEDLPDGTRFIADGSVTSVKVEQALKNFGSGLPKEDVDKKIAIIASESGTLVHSFAENVWKNILDKEGRLLPDSEFKNEGEPKLTESVNSRIYGKMQKFIVDFAKTFPEGTRFFTEIKAIDKDYKWKERVYDESSRTYSYEDRVGMGMSADLLAITPDDVVNIFDYKSTSELEKKKEIPVWKIVAINAQIPEYSRILQKEYGFKNFGMMRAIPINLYYAAKKTGKIIDGKPEWTKTLTNALVGSPTGINKDAKSWLDFIPVDKEMAKDKRIDDLDKKLTALEQHLGLIRTSDINKQEELHKQILLLRTARYRLKLLQNGKNFKAQVEKTIQFAQEYFAEAKNNLLNLAPIDRHNLKDKLNIFAHLDTTFHDEMENLDKIIKDKDTTEEQKKEAKELKDALLEFSHDAKNLLKSFDETAIETANKLEIKNIGMNPNMSEKELNFWQTNLTVQSKLAHQMTGLLVKIKAQNISEIKDEMKLVKEKITTLLDKFKKIVGVDKGKAFYEAIDKHFSPSTTVYTKDFWERVKAARNHQNKNGVKEMQELMTFDSEAYNKALEELKENLEKSGVDVAKQKERLKSFKKRYNVKLEGSNRYAWQNKRNFFLKPKEEFKSKEYNSIQNNPELKEVFDGTFKLVHDKAVELGLIKPGTSIFKIFEGTEASDNELSVRGIKNKKSFKERNTISEKEINRLDAVDPITNEVIKRVNPPAFQHAEAPTRDIFDATLDVYEKLLNYEKKIEDEGLLLDLITKEQQRLVQHTNKYGKSANELGTELPGVQNVTNLKLFKENVYQYLYGIEPHGQDKTLNIPGFGKVSITKAISKPVHFFVLSKLGLNPKSLTSNFVGGFGHTIMIYGNLAFKALSMIVGRDKKLMDLMEYFNFTVGNEAEQHNLDFSGIPEIKGVSIKSVEDVLMMGMTFTEHLVQKCVFACKVMSELMDETGNFIPIKDYLVKHPKYAEIFAKETNDAHRQALDKQMHEEAETMQKTHSVHAISEKSEDGQMHFTNPFTQQEEDPSKIKEEGDLNSPKVEFENRNKDDIKSVLGTKDKDDRTGTEGSLLMTLLSTFRKWIASVVQHKFGDIRYSAIQKKMVQGYWRHFAAQFTKEMVVPLLKHITDNMTGKGFTTNNVESARWNYERLKEKATKEGNQFDIHGNPYGITFEQYALHHRQMIAKTLRDIGAMMATFSILAAINALASNEDDPEAKYRDIYISRYFQKYYNEFTFWVDYREFQNLMGNSVPALGLLTEIGQTIYNSYEYMLAKFGSEEALQNAHPEKYFVRLMPLGGTSLDLLGFDSDFREDWGIKTGQVHF